ncbi:MAG TPA: hypothetical protein DCM28_14330 [Phycisphaerales bacterium]|mgnify:CR=1 FL=1|nr:hypothetical protein [Phycisphaerales bacterium]HCD31932.1 hypothetical protein [Phycisphaerales bacterium]|tara:strand:+ start:16357 stop:17616 length:1260 start_codon:yes stop_codon:yes gene_type:complete
MTQSTIHEQKKLNVAMMQDGARRAYALPIALHKANALSVMYTDWYDRPDKIERYLAMGLKWVAPHMASKLTARKEPQLRNARICSWPITTLQNRLANRRYDSEADYYLYVAERDAKKIMHHQYHHANMLLGCIRNLHPKLLADARSQGIITVGDQIIAPATEEILQAKRQVQRWPDWQPDVIEKNVRAFVDFEEQSWANLDHILSMSEYVKQTLIQSGVNESRITLLPYPMDTSLYNPSDRSTRPKNRPVRVGFVGAVNLRKGAPEFLETAKRFDKRQAQFVMVGANHLNPDKLAPYQDHVQLVGKVPMQQITQWLDQFDIFFFPTTCEGSAGSVLEAMAMGLPIVTTPNAGSQVRDGIEGRIVSCADLDGYHEAIAQLIEEPDKRLAMGNAARERAMQFDMTWYQKALVSTLENFLHQ